MSSNDQMMLGGKNTTGTLNVLSVWKDYGPGGGGTPKTVSISPLAQSLLFVSIVEYSTATTAACAITDNVDGATGWNTANSGIGNSIGVVFFYKANIPGGITSLSVTTDSGATATIIVHEIVNADLVSPYNFSESIIESYTATTNPQTSGIINSTADSVFFALCANLDTSSTSLYTINGTGTLRGLWGLRDTSNSQELDATSHITCSVPYKNVSTVAATAHGWTTNNFAGVKGLICFS